MTKAEMIEKIAKDAEISKAAAGKAYDSFLDGIKGGLKKRDSRVTLVGFGTFKKVYRKTRKGRNPQTGEQIKNQRPKCRNLQGQQEFSLELPKG